MVGFRGAFQENLFAPHLHKKPLYRVRDEIYITVFYFARKLQQGRNYKKALYNFGREHENGPQTKIHL